MKRYIIGITITATLFIYSCGEGNHGHDHSSRDSQEHYAGDSHNHSNETEKEEHSDEISFTREQAEAIGLETEQVVAGTFTQVIKVSGQIKAAQGDETTIAATSNGVVSFVNPSITEGTAIRAGEAIVSISAKNLQEGDPAVKAKIAYEIAQKEFQRAEELVKDRIISAKEYEQIRLRYETAKTTFDAHASNITAKGVKVTAPVNGYIKNRLVKQGDYVAVGQSIATVTQNRRLQLRAEVSENNFKYLKNINGANFRPAYDNIVYKLSDLNGRLVSFGKTSAEESFYVPVTFEFDNVGDIIPGSYVEVYLLAVPQNDVISIPVSAVTEEQDLYFVYLQLDDEGYKKQEVTLGQNDGERVLVLSGLNIGDKVVTKGVYQVKLAATSSVMPESHSH
ncbi:MAG: efflux RND transporter periplasmic adaptor subunit [Prevotellaceae bacterium]|jgi:RND family efflux transporter MFP subunit|nr:efflux RND transporter periplasmic adaptor subunit [Prevotellaceae bacterium]